eukprot:369831_1
MSIVTTIAIHLLYRCHCILPDTIPTALHGGVGGGPGSTWSSYPVKKILSWQEVGGGYWEDAVTRLQFQFSDGSTSSIVGSDGGASCGSVTLDDGEYINAYRVWTAQPHGNCGAYTIYVFGFAFRTNKGNTFQCGESGTGGCGTQDSTGWVTYEGYFMGGVNWRGGSILDAIGFCFIREDLAGAEGLSCDPPPSCTEQGDAFDTPHACQCETECTVSGCKTLETVATLLGEELVETDLCPNPADTCYCETDDTGCAVAGASFTLKPHRCECLPDAECSSHGAYCNPFAAVSSALDGGYSESEIEGLCEDRSVCCCSCNNCDTYINTPAE